MFFTQSPGPSNIFSAAAIGPPSATRPVSRRAPAPVTVTAKRCLRQRGPRPPQQPTTGGLFFGSVTTMAHPRSASFNTLGFSVISDNSSPSALVVNTGRRSGGSNVMSCSGNVAGAFVSPGAGDNEGSDSGTACGSARAMDMFQCFSRRLRTSLEFVADQSTETFWCRAYARDPGSKPRCLPSPLTSWLD